MLERNYWQLFRGVPSPLSGFEKDSGPNVLKVIDSLMKSGDLVGQRFFTEKMDEDMMIIYTGRIPNYGP